MPHVRSAARAALLWIALAGWLLPPAAIAATKPPEPESIVLAAADSVKIAAFWFDCYEDEAPAVLLLHDHGRDHFGWRTLWPILQRLGFHVLALDLRGHGASKKLAPEKYQLLVQRDPAVLPCTRWIDSQLPRRAFLPETCRRFETTPFWIFVSI